MLNSILLLISGLGIFLFSTKLLSVKLETLGGNKLRKKINQFSSNRFKAFGFGCLLTTVFQSTTASVVMVSSFTSVGMLTLFQALSLIIGVNVASAIPAYLISFQSFGITNFFCAITAIGAFIYIFAKKTWIKNMAIAFVSFGLIFVGLMLMKNSMSFLLTEPSFISFFSRISNPVVLMLLGAAFTVLLQSSLGTTALVISLIGTSTIPGIIPTTSAIYIVYGALFGSALTTALFASISTNLNGKRTALFHVLFSFIVCIIFGILSLTNWVNVLFYWIKEPSFKLITAYLFSLIVVAILLLPFIKIITIFLCKTVKPRKRKKTNPLEVYEFTDEPPAIAIVKASKKLFIFYNEIKKLYELSANYIFEENNKNFKSIYKKQQKINFYINKFNECVASISSENNQIAKEINKILIVSKHFERIAHNCKKILDNLNLEKKFVFSAKLNKYLLKVISNTLEMFEICQLFIQDLDCDFLIANNSPYEKIITLAKTNSEIKINSKTQIIENATKTKLGIQKNTIYIELTSYLNMISNNISDVIFALSADNLNKQNSFYEQISLEEINLSENLN